ncbi:MAG TPA: hypothetical protein VFG42_00030 [Baekduia sp.]|uniref:hypothetical protein n=1 Tax=Baekduia sp. TaxID=2600305 RepID=UPI002D79DFEE|nr:hypothetical protein [Baekduia sp.]HET6505147.1 hypothetical protein [Baekduia sp.]
MANATGRWAATPALVATAALALAGCGGDATHPRATAAPTPTPAPPTTTTTAHLVVDLDPAVTGRELLRLQRTGPEPGAHDLLKYGSDGSAVIVQAYGGGGERIRECTLRAGVLSKLRRHLDGLPLGPRHRAPEREYVSIYANGPARYTLVAGRHDTSFTDDTMPSDARPFVKLLEDTLYGRAADCETTYRSRVS